MPYAELKNNVVFQIKANDAEGLIEVGQDVYPGLVHDGSSEYENENFSAPVKTDVWNESSRFAVDIIQKEIILSGGFSDAPLKSMHDVIDILRHQTVHDATDPADYIIDNAKEQEILDFWQVVRANDEKAHSKPSEAIAALEALVPPSFA